MTTRVLIADDHPIFRQGLVAVFNQSRQYEVVGEADNGNTVLELLDSQKPSLVVIDISMPGMDGLEVIRRAQTRSFDGQFIVLTMYKDEEYFREAMSLGVKGYLLKDSASNELVNCLSAVSSGRSYVSAFFSDYLMQKTKQDNASEDPVGSLQKLSPTERRILRMIAENKTSKEIADDLNLSFRTVQNHRSHMCEKLKLEGYNKLLQFALEHKSLL
jgi:DNA-binding NarL/FixJ family response regulator